VHPVLDRYDAAQSATVSPGRRAAHLSILWDLQDWLAPNPLHARPRRGRIVLEPSQRRREALSPVAGCESAGMRVWSARGEQRDRDAGPVAMNRGVIAVADVDGRASHDHPLGGAVLSAKVTLIAGASRMSSAARLVVIFVALVCCAVWAAPAAATRSYRSAGVAPAGQVVLGSSFRPIRAGVTRALASGDYLLSTIQGVSFFPLSTAPMLINDRTGTTTALDPRCDGDGLGAPWVVLSCPQAPNPYAPYDLELYSLAHGTRQ
jgi:hypothetical protein